jgi:hypothetical protein
MKENSKYLLVQAGVAEVASAAHVYESFFRSPQCRPIQTAEIFSAELPQLPQRSD